MKGGVTLESGVTKPSAFIEYSGLCGWALALAHARSGDPARIAGYLGQGEAMDVAVERFAAAYADQTEADHQRLVEAVRAGRIEATTGM